MPSKDPHNHSLIWSDLLEDSTNSASNWWQIIVFLYHKKHGYSNYRKCLKRDHQAVRSHVLEDKRIKQHLADDPSLNSKQEIILDEMCHLLDSQGNPSRRLKIAGSFFLKCITKVYSNIYVNNHLLPICNGFKLESNSFKEEYLRISKELPLVILPTHRSYMDFLFISYIMTLYELPLPIVATGDNFKALGRTVTNYLKSTGAFLVRRNAQGGEHPMEFFMEGTRTRVGQVLRPKTGLLSMVADTVLDHIIEDVYILPVAINYQRPIEEQLYIAENTPEINRRKPKESTRNLIHAFDTIMKRKYGKVYVRFLQPIRLSDYFNDWREAMKIDRIDEQNRDEALHDFTISLASKICLTQATNNILMPFNLITCSILSRSFLKRSYRKQETEVLKTTLSDIVEDFYLIEDLLRSTQDQFLPGWESHLEIIDEFELDRDGIVRASPDRKFIEYNNDALTFQTMLYYSNQLIQVLLPVAICLLAIDESDCWASYKTIRTLLSREFFANELFIKREFDETLAKLKDNKITSETKSILSNHLNYFIGCYLVFLQYLERNELFDKNEFFQHCAGNEHRVDLHVSKDMLKNMIGMVKDEAVCESIPDSDQLRVIGQSELRVLIKQYMEVQDIISHQQKCRIE